MVTNTTKHDPTCGLDHSRAYCQLLTLLTLPTLANVSKAVSQPSTGAARTCSASPQAASPGRPTYLPTYHICQLYIIKLIDIYVLRLINIYLLTYLSSVRLEGVDQGVEKRRQGGAAELVDAFAGARQAAAIRRHSPTDDSKQRGDHVVAEQLVADL